MEVEMLDLECRHGLLSTFLHLLFLFLLHPSKMSPRSPMELTRPERLIMRLLLASHCQGHVYQVWFMLRNICIILIGINIEWVALGHH